MTPHPDDQQERIRKEAEEEADKNEDRSFTQPSVTDPYHSGEGPYADPRPGSMSS